MYSALNYFEAFYTCTYIHTIFSDDVYTILHLVYTILVMIFTPFLLIMGYFIIL